MLIAIAVILCALAVAAAVVGPDRLQAKRDYFFMLFLSQALLYLVVMPTLDAKDAAGAVVQDYQRLEILAVVLFVIPATLTYRFFARRIRTPAPPTSEPLHLTDARAAIFAALLIGFEVLFLAVVIQNDMLIRRIGTYALAERQANLHPLALLVMRSHDLISLPLVGYLLFLQMHFRRVGGASTIALRILIAPLVVGIVVLTLTAVTSSRGVVVLAATLLLGTFIFYSTRPLVRVLLPVVLPTVLVTAYLVLLVPNIRIYTSPGGRADNLAQVFLPMYAIQRYVPGATPTIEPTLSPTSSGTTAPSGSPRATATGGTRPSPSETPLADEQRVAAYLEEGYIRRLDCINLIQLLEPSLARSGYEFGAAWRVPAFIALTQFVAPGASEEYKRTARTTAKSYLLERHTTLDPGDYYSCSLTDLFGNFGAAGFPIGAALVGAAFVALRQVMSGGVKVLSSHVFWFGLVFAVHIITFEQEFSTYLFGWMRYLPAVVGLFLVNPVAVLGAAPAPLYRVRGILRRR